MISGVKNNFLVPSPPQKNQKNKLSNVLITDNEIIGFDKFVEVVAIKP